MLVAAVRFYFILQIMDMSLAPSPPEKMSASASARRYQFGPRPFYAAITVFLSLFNQRLLITVRLPNVTYNCETNSPTTDYETFFPFQVHCLPSAVTFSVFEG